MSRQLGFAFCLISSLIIMVSQPSFAQQRRHGGPRVTSDSGSTPSSTLYGPEREVSLSTTFAEFASASGTNYLRATVNYKKFIKEGMEVGGRVDMAMATFAGSSNTYMGLWGTFTYNFQSWNISDSYYAVGALGLVDEALASVPAGNSEKKFSWAAYGGKRFHWMDKLFYTPEAGLRKIGSTDMAIVIVPLNITLLW